MPVRDRVSSGLMRLSKVFGTSVPPEIEAAQAAAGMDTTTPFSPGAPLSPYDGYSRTPRSQDFTPQRNIAARPRSTERVSFETLRGLIEAYDIAQICLYHRIDSIRSLEWSLVAADGYRGDVTDAVAVGMAVLSKPDRQTPFDVWLGAWLYDVLAYDAGTLWRMRNRAGQVVGLRAVDGTSIAPLIDAWGNTPGGNAPAYVQYAQGLPWNWQTTRDLIYSPYRKRNNSPYGHAPLEAVLLGANTDLRFQQYFLQRFTEGNIPAAFAAAPESWTPEQIEMFQSYWDGFLRGDQSFKSQVRWMPGGTKFAWSNEKEFDDKFSLFLAKKTMASFHVVPSDAGFTENVNKSSGETQSDVQHRIGDTPLAKHASRILTAYLQDDLHLPIQHQFDLGEEQDDRLATAQADDIYVKLGAISPSDIREMRYGLSEPAGKRVARFIFSNRGGPIPLSALEAVAGPVDQESGAPDPAAELPHKVFQAIEGVEANPPTPSPPLAVQVYGPDALPTAAPQSVPAAPVAKEGPAAAAPTAGITAATGITSYDLIGRHDDDEDDEKPAVIKGAEADELARFRDFVKQRKRLGRPWRDFEFTTVDPAIARMLNASGPDAVRKGSGTPGLAKRSGMISLDLPPGTIPMIPGGVDDHHVTVIYLGKDVSDDAFAEACDRAQAAAAAAPGPIVGVIAGVDSFPPSENSDGKIPAFAPVILPGVEALYESLADLSASGRPDYTPHATLAYVEPGDPLPPPVPPTGVTITHLTVHRGDRAVSFPLGPGALNKAGGGPKAPAPGDGGTWPGWDHDEKAADHWAPEITAACASALSHTQAARIARDFTAAHPEAATAKTGDKDAKTALEAAALAWLLAENINLTDPIAAVLAGLYTDGYLVGVAGALAIADGVSMDVGGWAPGRTDQADTLIDALGARPALDRLLGKAPDTAAQMAHTRTVALAAALAAGAISGHTPTVIAAAMLAALTVPWRSIGAAITEITRASGIGAFFGYRKRKIDMGRWVTLGDSKVCAICVANAAVGPVPIGKSYPSGDTNVPAHTGDRCAVVPA